jgi:sugar/nucleoside kinase (ribokinase family)
MDLVSVGNILKETMILEDGSRHLVLGSPAAYTTVCASRLGAKVGIVTHCGKDMPAELLSVFDEVGVDVTGLNRNAPNSTTNELGYDSQGRKRILRYFKKAPNITAEDIPDEYLNSRVFYCCGVDFDIEEAALEKLASAGALMASDIGGMGGTGRPEDVPSPFDSSLDSYRRLISHFRIMKASEDDVMILTGCSAAEVTAFIEQMLSWGPEAVLLTKGSEGVEIYTRSGIHRVPVIPCKAIDTTGAGDCFMAGFLVDYADSGDLVEAASFGSTVASHVVLHTGGVVAERMPKRDWVEQRLQAVYSLGGKPCQIK